MIIFEHCIPGPELGVPSPLVLLLLCGAAGLKIGRGEAEREKMGGREGREIDEGREVKVRSQIC